MAGVRADGATPGPFFAHDPQMLANDFAPECIHPASAPIAAGAPVVRVNGGLDDYGPGVLAGEHTDDAPHRARAAARRRSPSLRAARVVASEPVAWE